MAIDWKEIGIIPLTDAAGITKVFNASTHRGLDIGWYKNQYCPVLAWQDGKVIAKGYSGECGYWVVLEHTYSTGKRWVGYIHLYQAVNVAIGTTFKMGEKIGNAKRGNTGVSNGTHLHIYMTKIVPKNIEFYWTTDKDGKDVSVWKDYAIDPLPHLYHDKKYNTEYIASSWGRPLPEKIIYPEPVKRDESKHQVDIQSDTRRLRKTAGGVRYDDMCQRGIYNVLETSKYPNSDFKFWCLIAEIEGNQFWVAVKANEDLEPKDYKALYEEEKKKNDELKAEVDKLEVENIKLEDQYATISKDYMTATGKLKRVKEKAVEIEKIVEE